MAVRQSLRGCGKEERERGRRRKEEVKRREKNEEGRSIKMWLYLICFQKTLRGNLA